MVDSIFLLAIAALGLGISLSTYKLVAERVGWPMGEIHHDTPYIPLLIGLLTVLAALVVAIDRGPAAAGGVIIACGVIFAVFWTGFLRVASQVSLFVAPLLAAIVFLGWLATEFGP